MPDWICRDLFYMWELKGNSNVHWELEFPEVFFGDDGEKIAEAGFDAVVGNPPYVFISSIPEQQREYFKQTSKTWDYRFDLYGIFTEVGHELLQEGGIFGHIIPHNLLNNNSFEQLRTFLLQSASFIDVYDFTAPVFEDASNETMVLLSKKDSNTHPKLRGVLVDPEDLEDAKSFLTEYPAESISNLPGNPFLVRGGDWVTDMLTHKATSPLKEHIDAVQGLRTGNNTKRLSDKKESENHRRALGGEDVYRYDYSWSETYVLYSREVLSEDPAARPREKKFWDADEKLLVQEIRNVHLDRRIVACFEPGNYIGLNTTNAIILDDDSDLNLKYILAILSSSLINKFFKACFVDNHIATQYLQAIPIIEPQKVSRDFPENCKSALSRMNECDLDTPKGISRSEPDCLSSSVKEALTQLSNKQISEVNDFHDLNLDVRDHFGTYSDGPALSEVGLIQPPENSADSILQKTTEQKPNLRAGEATVIRESTSTVEIQFTARYKPNDEDAHETDQWGYTETDPLPALRITDLTETEADLIGAFVPIAVNEAGGFADFRETATKTNSLVDRLRNLTLPTVDDVRDGLESYQETKKRAKELDRQIQRTDNLIDEIVYDLYGLADEEIEIIEESINRD